MTSTTQMYLEALGEDDVDACKYVYAHGGASARYVEWLASTAAQGDRPAILRQALEWGARDLPYLLTQAVWAGRERIVEVLSAELSAQGRGDEAEAAAAEGRAYLEMGRGTRPVPEGGVSFAVHIPMVDVGAMLGYSR